ncbi:MAG: rRNA maturation RNase YbeY [Candidatus Zixiibacteriota bacterium]
MPEVLVKNLHLKKKVNLKSIKNLAEKILSKEKNRQNLNIILADDKYIIRLNRKFSRRNRSTDVLSFGMQEGKKMIPQSDVLGEIYISLDRAEKQAKDYKHSLQKEVNLLAAHGLLHLLGYDHKEKGQKRVMRKKEEGYLSSLS